MMDKHVRNSSCVRDQQTFLVPKPTKPNKSIVLRNGFAEGLKDRTAIWIELKSSMSNERNVALRMISPTSYSGSSLPTVANGT
jgi:hypothetical protein